MKTVEKAAPLADVIFTGRRRELLQEVWRWRRGALGAFHVGRLENVSLPELLESPVIPPGSRSFQPSLGEFVLGAILFFAKDFVA